MQSCPRCRPEACGWYRGMTSGRHTSSPSTLVRFHTSRVLRTTYVIPINSREISHFSCPADDICHPCQLSRDFTLLVSCGWHMSSLSTLTRFHTSRVVRKSSAARFHTKTRMHSSRMGTIRSNSRLVGEGESATGGLLRGMYLLWGGVCLRRGGTCSGEGVGILACTETDHPPVSRITDRCKNITFATSLRTVKSFHLKSRQLC